MEFGTNSPHVSETLRGCRAADWNGTPSAGDNLITYSDTDFYTMPTLRCVWLALYCFDKNGDVFLMRNSTNTFKYLIDFFSQANALLLCSYVNELGWITSTLQNEVRKSRTVCISHIKMKAMVPLCLVTRVWQTELARFTLVIFRRPSMVTNVENSVATIQYLTGKSCYLNLTHLLIFKLKARKPTK